MFDHAFWTFLGLAALLTITPGADTLLTLRNAIAGGTRAGLRTMAGVMTGFFFRPMLAAFGVAALFVRSEVAFGVVRTAGALYLMFLGVQSLRASRRIAQRPETPSAGLPGSGVTSARLGSPYREGLITNALNPKIAVFYFAVLPQFIGTTEHVLLKSLLLAASHYLMGAVWLSLLALAAGRARPLLAGRRVRSVLEAISGVAMIGFGLRLATARAR